VCGASRARNALLPRRYVTLLASIFRMRDAHTNTRISEAAPAEQSLRSADVADINVWRRRGRARLGPRIDRDIAGYRGITSERTRFARRFSRANFFRAEAIADLAFPRCVPRRASPSGQRWTQGDPAKRLDVSLDAMPIQSRAGNARRERRNETLTRELIV